MVEGRLLRNVRKESDYSSIPATVSKSVGILDMGEMRDLVVTCRCTYNASSVDGIRASVYYSPDGKLFDTVPLRSMIVDMTAGATIQESMIMDRIPAIGYLRIEITNLDINQAVTNVSVWTSYSRYGDRFIEMDKNAYAIGRAAQTGGHTHE